MRMSDGTVYIDTRVDTAGFGKGMNTMQKQIGGLSTAIMKMGGLIATVFVTGKLFRFGKEAIDMASDLQEVQNVVDVVFGDMNDEINKFAEEAIEKFGLSEYAAKQYASTMGAILKSMGFTTEQAAQMGMELTGLAGDMASFYNLDSADAFAKLRAGISGETEPLKQLGINLSAANLEQFALAEGIKKTYSRMTEMEKAMLRYKYILHATTQSQGDFARTSGSWANQLRILKEAFNNFKRDIGQGLINIFTPLLKVLNTVISRLATAAKYFRAFTELFVGKQTAGGGGSPGQTAEDLENIQNGYEGIADAADDASKANKNLLSGFDELTTFNEEDISGGAGGPIFDSSSAESATEDFEKTEQALEELRKKFPQTIAFIETAIGKFKELFEDIKIGDWFAVGGDVSGIFTGFVNMISDAIDDIPWKEIGNNIGRFLAGIEWKEVLLSVGNFFEKIVDAGLELWSGAFDAAPLETTIISAMAILKFTGLSNIFKNALISAFPTTLSLGKTLTLVGITFAIGFDVGKEIGKLLFPDDAEFYDNFTWFGEGGFFDSFWEGIGYLFEDLTTALYDFKNALLSALGLPGDIPDYEKALEEIANGVIYTDKQLLEIRTTWGLSLEQVNALRDAMLQANPEFQALADNYGMLAGASAETLQQVREGLGYISAEVIPAEEAFDFFSEHFDGMSVEALEFFKQMQQGSIDVDTALATMNTSFNTLTIAIKTAKDAIVDFAKSFKDAYTNTRQNIDSIVIGGMATPSVATFKMPALATGAVIPPNAPFAAILGDQRSGRNLEAPEDLIRQIVREEAGGNREMIDILYKIAESNQVIADKDLTIGDRDIARANARGRRIMGYSLITEG